MLSYLHGYTMKRGLRKPLQDYPTRDHRHSNTVLQCQMHQASPFSTSSQHPHQTAPTKITDPRLGKVNTIHDFIGEPPMCVPQELQALHMPQRKDHSSAMPQGHSFWELFPECTSPKAGQASACSHMWQVWGDFTLFSHKTLTGWDVSTTWSYLGFKSTNLQDEFFAFQPSQTLSSRNWKQASSSPTAHQHQQQQP